jgi:4-carboxymuconolactone decarboxylase
LNEKLKAGAPVSRIPYPSTENLPHERHDFIFDPKRRYLLNITRMMLHIPEGLWLPHTLMGRSVVQSKTIDLRLREIVTLRVAFLEESEYELFHHRSSALGMGMTAEEVEALGGEDFSLFSEAERALIAFTTEVTRKVSPSDATLAAARSHFPDSLLFEVIVIIGVYMTTARMAAVGGVELDSTPTPSGGPVKK